MKVTFSSDDLPAELSDHARFKLWHEIHNGRIASLEYAISEHRPFYARIEAVTVGQVAVGTMACSLKSAERGTANIAEDNPGGHNLFVNIGPKLIGGNQSGRDFIVEPGEAVLMSNADPLQLFGSYENAWLSIMLPGKTLGQVFAHPDDYTARRIKADNEALSLLKRYDRFLKDSTPTLSPELQKHAANTIADLVGMTLSMAGVQHDHPAFRGLRAARLAAIIEEIQQRFTNPLISGHMLAQELGLSVRYINELLHKSGASFAERVLELRLQKTLLMLSDSRNGHLLISEIALQCGFSDISYFNRCFRRRFGMSPKSAR